MGRPRTRDDNDPKVIKNRAQAIAWQRANPKKANLKHRRWRKRNRKHAVESERRRRTARRAADPEAVRYAARVRLLRPYGLSPEQWDAKFDAQGRCCAICRTSDSGGRWHTDHDSTLSRTAVRGILCVRCNIGIGQFKHDPDDLVAAAEYVIEHQQRLHPAALITQQQHADTEEAHS